MLHVELSQWGLRAFQMRHPLNNYIPLSFAGRTSDLDISEYKIPIHKPYKPEMEAVAQVDGRDEPKGSEILFSVPSPSDASRDSGSSLRALAPRNHWKHERKHGSSS